MKPGYSIARFPELWSVARGKLRLKNWIINALVARKSL
jgi:hypothetical protein